MFKIGDIVTNKKDLYLKWEDTLECGLYIINDKRYLFSYDLIYILDTTFKENSFVLTSYIKKESFFGKIITTFVDRNNKVFEVKLILLFPIRNLYIYLPIEILKFWKYK